jgi:hypothetical protein
MQTNEQKFVEQNKLIEDAVKGRINVQGNVEAADFPVIVGPSASLQVLAELMFQSLDLSTSKELPFEVDDLVAMAEYLVEARCAYVSGIKGERHPADIEYPAMFGPILAQIGKFRDTVANVEITPYPAKLVDLDEDGNFVSVKKGVRCKVPEGYDTLIRAMRMMGVPTVFGLPKDKVTTDDTFFRIECANEVLCGSKREAPSPLALFSRTLVNMNYLSNLFGDARISYAQVAGMTHALGDIVARNMDGPRA